MTVPSNENVTERRGGQGGPAREQGRLDPLAVQVAASSFLSLGRRPVLDYRGIPEGGQACIDLLPQLQRIGLLIERLQPLLLLLTEHSRSPQTLIGRLGFIPFAPHLVPVHRFFAEMHHRLEQVVVEPHPLIERVACHYLLRSIQAQFAEILAHQRVVFLVG